MQWKQGDVQEIGAEDRKRTRAGTQATLHRGPAVPLGPCLGLPLLISEELVAGSVAATKHLTKAMSVKNCSFSCEFSGWQSTMARKTQGAATNIVVKKLRKETHL